MRREALRGIARKGQFSESDPAFTARIQELFEARCESLTESSPATFFVRWKSSPGRCFFVFAVVFLFVRYWLLPNVENYRPEIVRRFRARWGCRVKIGALSTDWQGLRPRVSIADVRVYEQCRPRGAGPAGGGKTWWPGGRCSWVNCALHSFRHRRAEARRAARPPRRRLRRRDPHIPATRATASWPTGFSTRARSWCAAPRSRWLGRGAQGAAAQLSALNFRLENDGDEHSVGHCGAPRRLRSGPGVEVRARFDGGSVHRIERWSGTDLRRTGQ